MTSRKQKYVTELNKLYLVIQAKYIGKKAIYYDMNFNLQQLYEAPKPRNN